MSQARAIIDAEDPKRFLKQVAPVVGVPSSCGNCEWQGLPTTIFPNIPDLLKRLDVGGTVPSGECPECGALCYAVEAQGI